MRREQKIRVLHYVIGLWFYKKNRIIKYKKKKACLKMLLFRYSTSKMNGVLMKNK